MDVKEIKTGGQDAADVKITSVYIKQPPRFAIYRTKERVMVHYADDIEEAKHQSALLAPLNPVRGEINGLIDGWRTSTRKSRASWASVFDRRIADGLHSGLQEDASGALAILNGIKADIIEQRTSWARFLYLIAALAISTAIILIVRLIIFYQPPFDGQQTPSGWPPVWPLWLALAGGTIGAFFSIAIGIRSRTVLTDIHWLDNAADAVLRIIIGAIAAGVLVSLAQIKAFSLAIGDAKLGGDIGQNWLYVVVVAFVAGFSERLIPDLLAKSTLVTTPPSAVRQVPPPVTKPRGDDANAKVLGQSVDAEKDRAANDDEHHVDGCLCDRPAEPHEVTPDSELPPATGGVATLRTPAAANIQQ